MNKIITVTISSLALFSSIIFAREIPESHKKMLAELGLPLPDSGIKLVPRSTLGLSEEQMQKGDKAAVEMKTLGYAMVDTNRPLELLNFSNYSKTQFKIYANNTNELSTHLRPQIKDLKLAFKFNGIYENKSFVSAGKITILGVAPQGGYHADLGGWSGAAQFFDAQKIGTCSYAVMNVKSSHTAAVLAMEDVTYSVNSKATMTIVEGNKDSGFIYKVEWYDEQNFHELECANMKYSADKTSSVIALASEIDSN